MIKQRLRNYKHIRRELQQIQQKLEEVEAELYHPKVQRLTGMPSGGKNGSAMESKAIKHLDLLAHYQKQREKLDAEQLAVEQAIASLTDPAKRMLLRYLYIDGMKWRDASAKIHYSRQQANRIHDAALQELQRYEPQKLNKT